MANIFLKLLTMRKNTDGSVWLMWGQFQVKVFTNAEPGNTHHSVEISAGRAAGGSGVIWKFKVENKHNDQAVLILNWNHIDLTVKRNTCSDTETQSWRDYFRQARRFLV